MRTSKANRAALENVMRYYYNISGIPLSNEKQIEAGATVYDTFNKTLGTGTSPVR